VFSTNSTLLVMPEEDFITLISVTGGGVVVHGGDE
jgi:hypothetical protein